MIIVNDLGSIQQKDVSSMYACAYYALHTSKTTLEKHEYNIQAIYPTVLFFRGAGGGVRAGKAQNLQRRRPGAHHSTL